MATSFSYDNHTYDQFDQDMHEAAEAVAEAHRDLVSLERKLREKPGMKEVADAVRLAYLELAHPAVEGTLNHLGVEFNALRV